MYSVTITDRHAVQLGKVSSSGLLVVGANAVVRKQNDKLVEKRNFSSKLRKNYTLRSIFLR